MDFRRVPEAQEFTHHMNNVMRSSTLSHHGIPPSIMSTRVQSLASDIYKELEHLVASYGNKFLHNLMPLIISALETVDLLDTEKKNLQLDMAVLREDQSHLLVEYEKERSARKSVESRLLHIEDELEEERKMRAAKENEFIGNSRQLESKLKCLTERLSRFEEKECDMSKEYQNLYSRYVSLLQYFAAYVDRVRYGMECSKCDSSGTITDNKPVNQANEITSSIVPTETLEHTLSGGPSSPSAVYRTHSLSTFDLHNFDDPHITENRHRQILKIILETTPELQNSQFPVQNIPDTSFDELSQGDFLSEDGHDERSFDGSSNAPQSYQGDSASLDMFNGVTREVNNLVKENQDLVQTKNALNVVTNDLIGRLDELTCENARLSTERDTLLSNGTGLLVRINELEQECRRLRQELESTDPHSACTDSECDSDSSDGLKGSDTPFSMRNRFSRLEMARVLLERNYYKEQLLELQDSVRLTELLRVQMRGHTDTSPSRGRGAIRIWFSKLFTASKTKETCPTAEYESTGDATFQDKSPSGSVVGTEAVDFDPATRQADCCSADVSRQPPSFSGVTSLNTNLTHASGRRDWIRALRSITASSLSESAIHSLPICYVRPVSECGSFFRLSCATITFLDNEHPLYESIDGNSVLPPALIGSQHPDSAHMQASGDGASEAPSALSGHAPAYSIACDGLPSSVIWLCSNTAERISSFGKCTHTKNASAETTTVRSLITIINADAPSATLDCFGITSSTVLCISAIPATNSRIQAHLLQTTNYWLSIPLTLSEELQSSNRRLLGVHHSHECYPVSNIHGSQTPCPTSSHATNNHRQHLHHNIADLGVSSHSDLPCVSPVNETVIEPTPTYVIERKRFSTCASPDVAKNPPFQHISSGLPSSSTSSYVPDSVENRAPNDTAFSTSQPTVWIGCQSGDLFVHPAMGDLRQCQQAVRLPDSILQIRYFRGRVFVCLANGQIVVFRRTVRPNSFVPQSTSLASSLHSSGTVVVTSSNIPDVPCVDNPCTAGNDPARTVASTTSANSGDPPVATWDFSEACFITYGHTRSRVRETIIVPPSGCLWTSCWNEVLVIDTTSLSLISSFKVRSSGSQQVQYMSWFGHGVWVAMRHDTNIQLFHVFTQQLLQTVDVDSLITDHMLSSPLPLIGRCQSSTHSVTALSAFNTHLWVGTNTGLIITLPFKKGASVTSRLSTNSVGAEPGTIPQVSKDPATDAAMVVESEMLICRHHHEKSVKFLISCAGMGTITTQYMEPMTSTPLDNHRPTPIKRTTALNASSPCAFNNLVISGGQGYSFHDAADASGSRTNRSINGSHIIVWKSA
ncbi:unnamed protein product [Dicrocoelium dendriticum]|nr:unnamed protein product [Dicrocoelium dendriticum]